MRFNIICTSQIIEEKSNDIFSSPQTCLSCGLLLAFDENFPMRFPSRISIAISLSIYLTMNKFLPNCMWFCDFIACPRLLTLQDENVLKLFDHPPLIRSFNHGKENNFELCVQKLIFLLREMADVLSSGYICYTCCVLHIYFHDP